MWKALSASNLLLPCVDTMCDGGFLINCCKLDVTQPFSVSLREISLQSRHAFSLRLFRCCLFDKLQLAQIRYRLNKNARRCGGSLGVLDKADGKGNEEEAAELQEVRWSGELVEMFKLFQTFSVSSHERLQILTTKSESVFDSWLLITSVWGGRYD